MFLQNLSGATAILFGSLCVSTTVQAQRLLGLDVSAWQGDISQTTWNNIRNVENRRFVFIRSSRGGTTGWYDQSDPNNSRGQNTLSQRYDDPYLGQNIMRATAAGIFAGAYHFSRPDIVESTLNSGGIRNNGTDEANQFIQRAGPWMRPGYLVPIHDLEAGEGFRSADELAQFCIDFSNRIYAVMGIRPGIYVNGNYAGNILQNASASLRNQLARPAANRPSVISPCYPVLWVARWPNQADPNAVDIQNTNPKDTFSGIYGPWDDYGDANPWAFWQYASTGRLQSFDNGGSNLDFDVARGDLEFLKDQLVPAVWINNASGDWSDSLNWNSGRTVPPWGMEPWQETRLPGAAGTGVNSGMHDTVIIERPNVSIVVTLSSGTHNIRKLFLREAMIIRGGSLTVNYDPEYEASPNPSVARSGSLSAHLSDDLLMYGGRFSTRAIRLDASRVIGISDGVVEIKRLTLMPGATPAMVQILGKVKIGGLGGATATIANGAGAGSSGVLDLVAFNSTIEVMDGAAEVDLSVEVPIVRDVLIKTGPGTMRVTSANTYSGETTISEGRFLANNASGSATGVAAVHVTGGILGGMGRIGGVVTVEAAATLAAGTESLTGVLTLNSPPRLAGTVSLRVNRDGAGFSDHIAVNTGTLIYGGRLAVAKVGGALVENDTFTIISAPAFAGEFAQVDLPALGSGLIWDLGMLNVDGSIRVVAGSPTARFDAAPVFEGGVVRLRFVGQPGWTYFVERSTDLVVWEEISTVRPPSSGVVEFVDAEPPQPAAFYRVRWLE